MLRTHFFFFLFPSTADDLEINPLKKVLDFPDARKARDWGKEKGEKTKAGAIVSLGLPDLSRWILP